MKKDNNKITVKSYLFLIGFFMFMFILFFGSLIIFNVPLIIFFALSILLLGVLIILLEPKNIIRFKYKDIILLDIGKGE